MNLPQQKFRELVFQVLYSQDFVENDLEGLISFMMMQFNMSKKNLKLALDKADLILETITLLDEKIERASVSYSFDRIPAIEKNILRVGVYELLFCRDVPPKVVFAEALRLARKYSTKESMSFVNAILDAIYTDTFPDAPPLEKQAVQTGETAECTTHLNETSL